MENWYKLWLDGTTHEVVSEYLKYLDENFNRLENPSRMLNQVRKLTMEVPTKKI